MSGSQGRGVIAFWPMMILIPMLLVLPTHGHTHVHPHYLVFRNGTLVFVRTILTQFILTTATRRLLSTRMVLSILKMNNPMRNLRSSRCTLVTMLYGWLTGMLIEFALTRLILVGLVLRSIPSGLVRLRHWYGRCCGYVHMVCLLVQCFTVMRALYFTQAWGFGTLTSRISWCKDFEPRAC